MNLPECLITTLEDDEITAIRAVANGAASEYQQKLALSAIVHKIARYGDLGFVPGAPDETAFLNGRMHVGSRIVKLTENNDD